MRGLVDQRAIADFAHFIDAVSELIAAIFDMDQSLGMTAIAAVDKSDAAHRPLFVGSSVNAERFQFAMQRRALHADEFGSARDIAAEPVNLGNEIFAFEN